MNVLDHMHHSPFEPQDDCPRCVAEQGEDEDCGYDLDDPKHPSYHDRMSDLWDMREGK